MPSVFADAGYFIALLLPSDALHANAVSLGRDLAVTEIVTTDAVLTEVLAYVSSRGPQAREQGVNLVIELRKHPYTTVVPQTRALFDAGLNLYRARPDKGYSLTDCMSMVACQREKITDVLTRDRHFAQEGLKVLL